MSRANGQVSDVQVLAWFLCDFCGGDCKRLSKAPVGSDGRIGPIAERPPGEIECNDCFKERRARDEQVAKARREQMAWRRKAVKR